MVFLTYFEACIGIFSGSQCTNMPFGLCLASMLWTASEVFWLMPCQFLMPCMGRAGLSLWCGVSPAFVAV